MTLLAERSPVVETTATLVAVSHGTSSPEGREALRALVAAVAAARPDLTVRAGFVDVQQPDVRAALAALAPRSEAVIVPLLLSAGYHVHVDLADQSAGALVSKALGPDDRLARLLHDRLLEAGLRSTDRIVLACAGSSDPRAVHDCHEMGLRLTRTLGRPVRVGFIAAAGPRLTDAVETERSQAPDARVVVSSYLLAPGYFADLARATTADVTTRTLLAAHRPAPPALVELVLHRYQESPRT